MASLVRVLAVDDQVPFLEAVKAVVGRTAGFELVGAAIDGEGAIEQLEGVGPHLVLMDVNMPGLGGIAAAREVKRLRPDVVVVLCSTYAFSDLPPDALTAGANAYLNKEDLQPSVLEALWAAHHGSREGD